MLSSTQSALSDSHVVQENRFCGYGALKKGVRATLGYHYPGDIQSGMALEQILDNQIESKLILTQSSFIIVQSVPVGRLVSCQVTQHCHARSHKLVSRSQSRIRFILHFCNFLTIAFCKINNGLARWSDRPQILHRSDKETINTV